jgi:CubicO group peptidase (beta-lactamase class C family)
MQLRNFLFAALTGLSQAQTPDSPASLLQPFVEKHELAGAVALVADKDKVLSVDAVGFADIKAGRKMTPDTLFWIASQSKGMTATAVMMLVDEGKISLDDPVEKHLPEFRGQMMITEKDADHTLLKKPVHPFTIREALSHTSGLPFKSAIEEPVLDGLPLATTVRSYAMTPLISEPGTRYLYSNAGINTAARVLEVVSGMPYETFLQKRLFDPLGMKDTTFWPDKEQLKRVATSYKAGPGKTGLEPLTVGQLTYPLDDRTRRFPMPAGGLFSTARDTALFCRMMLNGGELDGKRYLTPTSFAEMTSRQTNDPIKETYGLGFTVAGDGFGHGGAFSTNMDMHPGKNYLTVWMVQHAGYPGEGGKADNAFKKWAAERFARPQ